MGAKYGPLVKNATGEDDHDKYTPENLGWKIYGVYEFSKIGLFNRPFLILADAKDEKDTIQKLKAAGFKDNDAVAIRFSKGNMMNMPFFLGKFTLKEIAGIIKKERKDYVPIVSILVKSKFSASLHYDGKLISIELWPGIGGSKKNILNSPPDIIRIGEDIKIARYMRDRSVENLKHEAVDVRPYSFTFLLDFARKVKRLEPKLRNMLKVQDPLLCDLNCESPDDINFMGIQKSIGFGQSEMIDPEGDFYIARSLEELRRYDGKKRLFFDIPLDREYSDWSSIVKILKRCPKVYVKSLTMHLSVILREFGIAVERASMKQDYEVKEFSLR